MRTQGTRQVSQSTQLHTHSFTALPSVPSFPSFPSLGYIPTCLKRGSGWVHAWLRYHRDLEWWVVLPCEGSLFWRWPTDSQCPSLFPGKSPAVSSWFFGTVAPQNLPLFLLLQASVPVGSSWLDPCWTEATCEDGAAGAASDLKTGDVSEQSIQSDSSQSKLFLFLRWSNSSVATDCRFRFPSPPQKWLTFPRFVCFPTDWKSKVKIRASLLKRL